MAFNWFDKGVNVQIVVDRVVGDCHKNTQNNIQIFFCHDFSSSPGSAA